MERFPRQSLWEELHSSFHESELDEIKKSIDPELIDENSSLWIELTVLREIVRDMHSFESSAAVILPKQLHIPTTDPLESPSERSQGPLFNVSYLWVTLNLAYCCHRWSYR